jgi:hypothetical protein
MLVGQQSARPPEEQDAPRAPAPPQHRLPACIEPPTDFDFSSRQAEIGGPDKTASQPQSTLDTGWKPMLLCSPDWHARYGNPPAGASAQVSARRTKSIGCSSVPNGGALIS